MKVKFYDIHVTEMDILGLLQDNCS